MKRTPLFSAHQKSGAKLIEFGGWEMPVYYTSIVAEHQAVRQAAGLFDISHMGEFLATGPAAAAFLNRVLTNDLTKLQPGQGQYSLLCLETGGVVDDLYVYRLSEEAYLLVVNASRIEADWQWLEKCQRQFAPVDGVTLKNVSNEFGAVAVQGPKVAEFIDDCFPNGARPVSALRKNEILAVTFSGQPVYISRTGYTGEDGFEVVAPADSIESIWNRILQTGQPAGLVAAGLGARDTLRTEACYPLYGHELDEQTTPLEAGLGFFVAMEKGDFIGRAALTAQKEGGLSKKLAAFTMQGRTPPPRPHYSLCQLDGGLGSVGQVTSGTQSPTLGMGIGLGYVPPALAVVNQKIGVEIRGQIAPAVVVKKPFYRKR